MFQLKLFCDCFRYIKIYSEYILFKRVIKLDEVYNRKLH